MKAMKVERSMKVEMKPKKMGKEGMKHEKTEMKHYGKMAKHVKAIEKGLDGLKGMHKKMGMK